ncbi:type II toxin-antitoxin system PemK/MazF family toxin [Clostridium sp. MT-14]|uniref:type II toxin-antitoxin system PemK/MazF family toxin n=1 Tax=Clostridium sp. MT-14 TaxID=3348360 RepID=UPI0035F2DB4E
MDKTFKEQLMNYAYKNSVNVKDFVTRGDVFWADFGEKRGHIQGGIRPCIIVSNDTCNRRSPVITVAPVTTSMTKNTLPTHVVMNEIVLKTSIVLCEGTTTLNKNDLKEKIGHCTEKQMVEVDKAVAIQMGLTSYFSISSKFNDEIFDIYKVQKMVKNINEMRMFIDKFDNPMVQPVKDGMNTLILELKSYCQRFNKNIDLFYKGNKINKNQKKERCQSQREVVAIG